MADTIFKYPFDPLGTSIANKVIGEAHTIGSRLGRIFSPDYGPFFGGTEKIIDVATGRTLEPIKDYKLVHFYDEAFYRTGRQVYAAIQISNPDVGTKLMLDAQQVGGEFSYSYYAIVQALEALKNDNRPVAWGDLIDVPAQFNSAPHLHDAYDLYGMKYLIASNYDIANAFREGDAASRTLLMKQVTDKLVALDQFCMAFADCFESGAAELRAIQ